MKQYTIFSVKMKVFKTKLEFDSNNVKAKV